MTVSFGARTPVTEAVARFACEHDLAAAPPELLNRATHAVIDSVGVTIAGRQEPSFTILAQTIGGASNGIGAGEATVLPTRSRATAADAALLNATAGHALDYDDVADAIKGHPSVPLVCSLLAVAEANGNTGREFLEAYVAGFEIECAIARGLPVEPHYRKGWHATATVGVIGAAAAVGRLLHLDESRMRHALGIAASMASGSRQNFGTMTKPLHAGLTARDAVIAAQLASSGFTADEQQLEGPIGYFQMYGVDPDPGAVVQALEQPNVLLRQGLSVKKYPCCYGIHRMADAALALSGQGVRGESVRSISVAIEPGGQQAIIHHRPTTGLQGKFSAEYVVAACLLDGRVGLWTFTDQAVVRAAAQELLRRVEIHESAVPPIGASEFDHAYAVLELTLGDGSVVRERCDVPRGDARAPLSASELEAKFRDCLEFAQSGWDAESLLQRLSELDTTTRVSTLLASEPALAQAASSSGR